MFMLETFSDLIQIDPKDFLKPSRLSLEDNINRKYANRIVQKVGLCIGMYDILQNSEGLIGHGTGTVNVNVKFRMVVFRPYKGEIIEGKIVECDKKGIRIALEFFQDIFVPGPEMLFEKSSYNEAEGAWMWVTDDGAEMFFDPGEFVRFRVESEIWHDKTPESGLFDAAAAAKQEEDEQKSPYTIIASMSMGALGLEKNDLSAGTILEPPESSNELAEERKKDHPRRRKCRRGGFESAWSAMNDFVFVTV
ncbi:hypothetical protein NA57DRAFT_55362 [Rhizodiscina lignyota]|uniref:DNA-directed RNA polymerase subunit n=1 Tax=Rhizodiscina lignyota TaxID=1504668 RepID=A0A9P4IJ17_9PEZI|nr:hypothetical protein NA57DRAFT_55362 [Rhizodiscina lignyota]